MNGLPREAREGLMRAFIEVLKERHPGVTWIARDQEADAAHARRRSEDGSTSPKAEQVSGDRV